MTQTLCSYAKFEKSGQGVNSLTVTWDIDQITRSTGARSALVTAGANSVTFGRRGLYGYVLVNADLATYDYLATAICSATGTVDTQELTGLWTNYPIVYATEIANLDATVSSRSTLTAAQVWANVTRTLTDYGTLVADIWSYATRTLTSISALVSSISASVWTYVSRTLTAASPTAIGSLVSGSSLILVRGDTIAVTLAGLSANTGYVSIDFSLKLSKDDPDTSALIRVRKNASGVGDGLLCLNGTTPSAALGSIIVVSATSLTINLSATASKDLVAATNLYYDVQYIFPTSVQTATSGSCEVTSDVTRAVV